MADPCYPGVVGAARLLGIPVTDVREGTAGLDVDHLAARCAQARAEGRRVRACYVAPDFSNPGGARMPLAARHALLDLAQREDLILVEDNTYAFTASEDDALPGLKALDTRRRVVHVGTFAKVGFPGARVGYAVADQRVGHSGGERSLAQELADLKTVVTVNTPPLSQAVVGGLLLEHGCSLRALARRKAERYRTNLVRLTDALERHLADGMPPGVSWHRPWRLLRPRRPACPRRPRAPGGVRGPVRRAVGADAAVLPHRPRRPADPAVMQLPGARRDRDRRAAPRGLPHQGGRRMTNGRTPAATPRRHTKGTRRCA